MQIRRQAKIASFKANLQSNQRQRILGLYRRQVMNTFQHPINTDNMQQLLKNALMDDSYFEDNKSQISNFIMQHGCQSNQNINSLLVKLAPILYESILSQQYQQYDIPSIEILKFITNYDEIELPQTIQLVNWLKNNISKMQNRRVFDSLQITSNLLSNPKYQNSFKQKLINSGYIQQIAKILNGFEQNSILNIKQILPESLALIAQILVIFIITPCINVSVTIKLSDGILNIIKCDSRSKWIVSKYLAQLMEVPIVNQQLPHNSLIIDKFTIFMCNQNQGLEEDTLKFLLFRVKNKNVSPEPQIDNFLQKMITRKIQLIPSTLNYLIQVLYRYVVTQTIQYFDGILKICFHSLRIYSSVKNKTLLQNILLLLLACIQIDQNCLQSIQNIQDWQVLLQNLIQIVNANNNNQNFPFMISKLGLKVLYQIVLIQENYQHMQSMKQGQFNVLQWLTSAGIQQTMESAYNKFGDKQCLQMCQIILDCFLQNQNKN